MTVATDSSNSTAGTLAAARRQLRVEQRQIRDELKAFETFCSRLRGIPTDQVTYSTEVRSIRQGTAITSGLVRIRDAYVATVMSVPHYDAEYNETYEQSIAAEFGNELALALTQTATLHEQYKASLRRQTGAVISEREELLALVEAESDAISRAESHLDPIADSLAALSRTSFSEEDFGSLDALRGQMSRFENTCDSVASHRQQELSALKQSIRLDESVPDLPTYLYHDLPVTYPVLAAVGTVGGRIETLRRDIERAMIHTT